ncbi:MAG: ParB/RepB/Spo0J family partition protein [Phycisphaerae bacterium]|nr:ParB/RepB/Spo0J family partition protein [Phycisphaerae bacterium]
MDEEQIQYVSPDRLVCRSQPRVRFKEELILGLARSIHEAGRVLQPLRVQRINDTLVVLDGERRLRAARKLGLAHVPVIIEDKDLCETEILHRQLILDCQKEHWTPVERAKAIQQLIRESGWQASQVAEHVGISPATVTKLLSVLELPPETQEQVAAGALGMSTAYAIARSKDPDVRTQLVDAASRGKLTRDGVVTRVRKQNSKRRTVVRQSDARKQRVSLQLAADCTMTIVGPEIKVEMLVAWLKTLTDRLVALEAQDMALKDAAERLARPSG